MDPIQEGFKALAEIADDSIARTQLETKIERLLSEKRTEDEMAKGYLEIEEELVKHSENLNEDDVRKRVRPAFEGADEEYPGFSLLFVADERQFIELSNLLIIEYVKGWKRFLGVAVVAEILRSSLAETTWKGLDVTIEKGIPFNPLRMRSVGECVEHVSELLENWHLKGRLMIGDDVRRGILEAAYRTIREKYHFLPTARNLLGATPRDVLAKEKAERIHELETRTSSQARSIRAADEDLRLQADRLQKTVEELEDTKQKLELTSQARSEFIDVVSHQFRTPLSSIRWNAELMTDALAEEEIAAEYQEAVDMMRIKSVYLIETLDRVFTTLDIDTGKLHLDAKPAFLWEVVQDVHDEYKKEIKRRGLKWKFNRNKEQIREIMLDMEKMKLVLRILISNAINYNKDGGKITVDLRSELENGDEFLMCSVSDEGIGLTPAEQEKLFNKFYRSKDATLKVSDGTGLGMYAVKHLIEVHKGKVWVESAGKDKGTTIAFSLPIQ